MREPLFLAGATIFLGLLLTAEFAHAQPSAGSAEPPTPPPASLPTASLPTAPAPPPSDSPTPANSSERGGSDIVTGAGKDRTNGDETAPLIRVEDALERPPEPRRTPPKTSSLSAQLEWRWPKFSIAQYGLSIGQALLAVGSQAIPGAPRWTSPNAFDDAVRDVLRAKNYDGYLYARDFSDAGLVLLVNQQLVDTLFATWWFHDKGSTAFQMALIDVQAVSFSAGINSFVSAVVGRERPYARTVCGEGGREESTTDCQGNNRYRSFFSGHTTAAFTLAALTCVHHANLPIYGGGAIEAVPCVTSMTLATGVALLRVIADQHYMSDIAVGTAFGIASGVGIPYLFHYGQAPIKEAMSSLGLPENVYVMPTPGGLSAGGTF